MTTFDNSINIILPADSVPGPKQGHWTYDDYAALPDDGRQYEIMNGVLIMSPSPSAEHQGIDARFIYYFLQFVEFAGLGRVFPAPFDVELAPDKVVQPDVTVLLNANLHKLMKAKINGAPDLVVEIASPSTALYDRLSKHDAYEEAGVSEYWLVNPEKRSVEVLVLEKSTYQSLDVFQGQDTIPSRVAPDIAKVRVEQFFV